jgi:hypothetical protein
VSSKDVSRKLSACRGCSARSLAALTLPLPLLLAVYSSVASRVDGPAELAVRSAATSAWVIWSETYCRYVQSVSWDDLS